MFNWLFGNSNAAREAAHQRQVFEMRQLISHLQNEINALHDDFAQSVRNAIEAERERDRLIEEVAQLGLGVVDVTHQENGKRKISLRKLDPNDARDVLLHQNIDKATKAQFRQVKQYFQTHQKAVTHLLDRLDKYRRKNDFSPEDLNAIADIRDELSATIHRKL